jgi:ferredoxin
MPEIFVDGHRAFVPDGATLLDAARSLRIAIPTLCHLDGLPPHASCMVCLVENERTGKLVPSCATQAADGDRVRTDGERVVAARRRSLDLLLAEHDGDCEAPCTRACPAHPDIPGIIRRIAAGDRRGALALMMDNLPLAWTLAEICPAPCQKSCQRRHVDEAIDICGLKRAAAVAGLAGAEPFTPAILPATGKSVAVIGGGPAGLSAAFFLARDGHRCVVFERAGRVGGAMPAREEALDADVGVLHRLGVQIRMGVDVASLPEEYEAIVVATGTRDSLAGRAGAFRCGNARLAQPTRLAVRSVEDGHAVARAVTVSLAGRGDRPGDVSPRPRRFDSHRHAPAAGDLAALVQRTEAKAAGGPHADPSVREALRCLDCDCRKKASCSLRDRADDLGGDTRRYVMPETRPIEILATSRGLSFEPGKCIRCGRCVRIAEAAGDRPGLSFSSRGPTLRVRVPFGDPLEDALPISAATCVAACPTGALAWDPARRKPRTEGPV